VLLRVGNGIFAESMSHSRQGAMIWTLGAMALYANSETDLIVALAGAAVRESVGAELQRNFRLALGDNGPRHGSAEEISVFVNGAGAERRPNVIAHKFLAQVFDLRCGSAVASAFLRAASRSSCWPTSPITAMTRSRSFP